MKPVEFFSEPLVDAKVVDACEKALVVMKDAGAKIKEVKPTRSLKYSVPIYYVSMFSEFSSAMQKFDGLKYGVRGSGETLEETVSTTRGSLFNQELKRRILLGTYVTLKENKEAYYARALKGRGVVAREVMALLAQGDFIVTPTMPCLPWKTSEIVNDTIKNYSMDLLTGPPAIAGVPAVSVPTGTARGTNLPVGIQFVGHKFQDFNLLRLAHWFEKHRGEIKWKLAI